jgi:PleD family two-component response regulator
MNLPNAYDRPRATTSSRSRDASDQISEIVIVDPRCDRYAHFVEAAMDGDIGLHFCCDAQSALKLSRRFRADVWLVSTDLPDMEGFDLLPLLADQVSQGEVDPLLRGHRRSLGRVGQARHSGIFMVADEYSLEEEQQALSAGIAGYLVQPVAAELVAALRPTAEVEATAEVC